MALPFVRSRDFAFTKAAGTPCRHLAGTACGVHEELLTIGMRGCVAYECFGAGQQVTQVTYAGAPARSPETFAVFEVVRRLHEQLALLPDGELRLEVERLTALPPSDLLALDLDALHARVGAALRAHSLAVRGPDGPSYAGVDWVGRDLRSLDLARADLRGALLIGADLRDVVLDRTDLLGADLRDADLRGADLTTALFVTRPQLNAARMG